MSMTRDEFADNVAALVAGLQVPVSMLPRKLFGTAFEPWQALLNEANHGFGWTNKDEIRAAVDKILESTERMHIDDHTTVTVTGQPPGMIKWHAVPADGGEAA